MCDERGEYPLFSTLDELVELVRANDDGRDLYVRWSSRPPHRQRGSIDALTGVRLPGLSANPLRVESWWDQRSPRLWIARRLYDYEHLRERQSPDEITTWLLRGRELARGPDNEPLIAVTEVLGRIAEDALIEGKRLVKSQHTEWRPLNRGR